MALPVAERRVLRKLLLCALAACVLLLGMSTAARRMIGPLHVHLAAAVLPSAGQSLALVAGQRAQTMSLAAKDDAHSHGGALRHRHDSSDASVAALDTAADDIDDQAGSSSAAFALTLHTPPREQLWSTPTAPRHAWPTLQQAMPASADGRLPDRPPQG